MFLLVAACRMSDDGKVLAVDRFDVDEHGIPPLRRRGHAGRLVSGLPDEQYAPTTERCGMTWPTLPADRLQRTRALGLASADQLRGTQCRLPREEHSAVRPLPNGRGLHPGLMTW